jgi:hypothetical protein
MIFKKLLPLENYTLTSKLSVDQVNKCIADNIESKKHFPTSIFNRNSTKEYEGEIIGNTFKINQILVGRTNSFAPMIIGNIFSYQGQTTITIEMQLLPMVSSFMILWLGIVGLVCIGLLLVGFIQFKQILQTGFSPMFFIPFIMFAFGCFLTVIGFKRQCNNSKEFLKRIFDGQEISE